MCVVPQDSCGVIEGLYIVSQWDNPLHTRAHLQSQLRDIIARVWDALGLLTPHRTSITYHHVSQVYDVRALRSAAREKGSDAIVSAVNRVLFEEMGFQTATDLNEEYVGTHTHKHTHICCCGPPPRNANNTVCCTLHHDTPRVTLHHVMLPHQAVARRRTVHDPIRHHTKHWVISHSALNNIAPHYNTSHHCAKPRPTTRHIKLHHAAVTTTRTTPSFTKSFAAARASLSPSVYCTPLWQTAPAWGHYTRTQVHMHMCKITHRTVAQAIHTIPHRKGVL